MQRSSESIAALVTALAKAQGELVNPEKSSIGSIITGMGRGDGIERLFRYAPLSAGSTSCARPWVSMRSRPSRQRPSIRVRGL